MSSDSQPIRLASGLLAGLALAATAAAQRVVPMSFAKTTLPAGRALGRRETFSNDLENRVNAYYVTAQIGTPPQNITLHVDTGSADLWVLSSAADLCNSVSLQNEWGTCLDPFRSKSSSTFQVSDRNGFSIRYVDETGASGDYFTDNVSLGGGKFVKDAQMGIATKSTNSVGILGIGYNTSVAADEPYSNVIDLMVDQGLIATKAYSMYLDSVDAETGTILFGGVDTGKFYGELKTVPISQNDLGTYSKFVVPLDAISLVTYADADSGAVNATTIYSAADSSSNSTLQAHLDSGTSLTYFPASITKPLYALLDAYDDTANSNQVFVNCAKRSDPNLRLVFQFGNATIYVPASEFILDDISDEVAEESLSLPYPASDVCRMGIKTATGSMGQSGYYLVGDTFLRSAYVVYDMTHNVIGLAQSRHGATDSKIVEIQAGEGLPEVSGIVESEEEDDKKTNAGAGGVRQGLRAEVIGVAVLVGAFTFGLGW